MTFQAFFLAFLVPNVLYYHSSIRKTKLLLPYFYFFFSSFPPFGAILWGPSLYFWRNLFKVFGGEVGKSLVFQTSSSGSSYTTGDWIETCFFSRAHHLIIFPVFNFWNWQHLASLPTLWKRESKLFPPSSLIESKEKVKHYTKKFHFGWRSITLFLCKTETKEE